MRLGKTMAAGKGFLTWERGWKRLWSGKKALWPLRGQSPEWYMRTVASEKSSWHKQLWGSQTQFPSQPQPASQPLWQLQFQWTWLLCHCSLKWHWFVIMARDKWGRWKWGCQAHEAHSHLSVSQIVSALLQKVAGSAAEKYPWPGRWWRWLWYEVDFQGMRGCGTRTAINADCSLFTLSVMILRLIYVACINSSLFLLLSVTNFLPTHLLNIRTASSFCLLQIKLLWTLVYKSLYRPYISSSLG